MTRDEFILCSIEGSVQKKMKEKYIQLPPLPLDLPPDSIEIIWLYAKMPQQERKMFQKFMHETLNGSEKDIHQTESFKTINDSDAETNSDVAEFTSLMQQMIGTLIAQACETAAIVYQYYCMDGKSIEEISEIINISKSTIQLISQYYDRKK